MTEEAVDPSEAVAPALAEGRQTNEACEDPELAAALAKVREGEAEVEQAMHSLETAEAELEEAIQHHSHRTVEVIVDRKPHLVRAGTYVVAKFKELVGVAADRELDLLKDGVLHPLKDDAEIVICGHEVFVSHVRTGCSS